MTTKRSKLRIPKEQQEIATRRKALGKDQKWLAATADCSPSTISKIERGEVVARGATLTRILKALEEQARLKDPTDIGGGNLIRDTLSLLERPEFYGDMHPLLRNAPTLGYRPLPKQGEAVFYQFSEEGEAVGVEAYKVNLFLHPDGRPGALDLVPQGFESGEIQGAKLVTLLLQHGIGLGVIERVLRGRIVDREWHVLLTLYQEKHSEKKVINYGGSPLAHAATWGCKYIEERFPYEERSMADLPLNPVHQWTGFEHVIDSRVVIDRFIRANPRLEKLWDFLVMESGLHRTVADRNESSGKWMELLQQNFADMAFAAEATYIADNPELLRRVLIARLRNWVRAIPSPKRQPYPQIDPELAKTIATVFEILPDFDPNELPSLMKEIEQPL